MKLHPRRSVLYMPGSNARALEKARTLAADGLILDLEDGAAPHAKALARHQIVTALKQGGYGQREVVVRINGLDTPWGEEDCKTMACAGADAILLPKVKTPEQVRNAVETLDQAGAPVDLPIWVMIETPRGVLSVDATAGSHKRLAVIVMGTSDLANEMQVRHTPDRLAFITALNICMLAARTHGLDILDGVHLDLHDDAGYVKACEQGRDWGFNGKTLIHPKQIDAANRIFAPDAAVLENARKMITAWEQASTQGHGVAVVNGRLVENLHVEEARRHLALAKTIAQLEQ